MNKLTEGATGILRTWIRLSGIWLAALT